MSQSVTVSVVIPTLDRREELQACVESVLAQTAVPAEVLVVDNGSSDGSADMLAAVFGTRVRVLQEPQRGVAYARNRGIAEAKGEIVAFIDDDSRADPRWLDRLLACLEETGAAGAGGPAEPRWEAAPPALIAGSAKALSYLGVFTLGGARRRLERPQDFLIGTNCAFRREIFESGHRFHPPVWGGPAVFEDVEFSRRVAAERPVYFEPAAVVRHLIPAAKTALGCISRTAFFSGRQKAATGGRLTPRGASDLWGLDGWLSLVSALGFASGALRRRFVPLLLVLAALGAGACSPAGRESSGSDGLLLPAEELLSRPPALELPGPVQAWVAERSPELGVYYVRSQAGTLGPLKSGRSALRLVLLKGKADIRSGAVKKACEPGAYVVVPPDTGWETARTGPEPVLLAILASPDAASLPALLSP
ncbi:MAG: hypothetical protein A2X36_04010 [Elusimicrobia bacterium GWA2_69_24]|nr:MAG: hypothetical protein A2X36_04010 [Elusimicrobia bacterium GWA2_69_24]